MFDYRAGLPALQGQLKRAFRDVLDSNHLVLGPQTEAFEAEFAAWTGAKHCVAVTSGTVALYVALRCNDIGPGDEVVTVANTCPPTVSAIRMTGARPVFVDVDPETLMMDCDRLEGVITEKTRAILPVHLWGNTVDMAPLMDIAAVHGLRVIEDCAQATGTRLDRQHVGTFGNAGCFSFYPTKNLGAFGDAGAVLTDDTELAARMRRFRMYGYEDSPVSVEDGVNARINELQAAFLRVELPHLAAWNERRLQVAARYLEAFDGLRVPATTAGATHAYHQFVIRCESRESVTRRLDEAGVGWAIHYAMPVHRMPAFERFASDLPVTEHAANEILSLPVHQYLADEDVASVIDAVIG